MKKIVGVKILENIACIILNVILVVMSIIVPLYYSVIAITAPETIAQIIQKVDYKTVIEESPNIKSSLKNFGISSTEADKYMKTTQAKELINIYTDEVAEIFLGIPDSRVIDMPLMKEIVNNNIDNFIEITEKNLEINLSKKEIEENVEVFFEENEFEVETFIPAIEETRTIVKTIVASSVIEKTLSLNFAIILAAAIVLIIVLICLTKKTKSFLFIGIDFAFSSVVLTSVLFFSHSLFVNRLALKLSRFEVEIIESTISFCTQKITIALFGMIGISILFIMFFFVILMVKRKYAKLYLNEQSV